MWQVPQGGDHKSGAHPLGGTHDEVVFPNGYGASIVRGWFSYGGGEGLYEVAVTHDDKLCYATPVSSDVEGRCTVERVNEILAQIATLPEDKFCTHGNHRRSEA